jgi:hypothetical protein
MGLFSLIIDKRSSLVDGIIYPKFLFLFFFFLFFFWGDGHGYGPGQYRDSSSFIISLHWYGLIIQLSIDVLGLIKTPIFV